MGKLIFQNLLLILILGLNLSGCATMETPKNTEQENRKPASHSWGNYHWARTASQVTLKLGDCLTAGSWKAHLLQASNDWNNPEQFGAASTPLLTTIEPGSSALKRCKMATGTTQVCNSKYGNNGWLGLASININGDHIIQGMAKMNDTYFNTSKYNNPNEKLHVMCQEIAHTFGLDHQSEDGSSLNTCMDYFSNTGTNATSTLSTRPNAHDFEQLNALYAHLDTSTTIASAAAAAGTSEVNDDPKSWGEFMREKSRGQSAYYEKFERNGSKTITHIYWTLETADHCKDCDHRDHSH